MTAPRKKPRLADEAGGTAGRYTVLRPLRYGAPGAAQDAGGRHYPPGAQLTLAAGTAAALLEAGVIAASDPDPEPVPTPRSQS